MSFDQLILAFATILTTARVLGRAFQHIGQPRVIGEMTAGILLGPSVFGRFFPGAFHYVFPSSSFSAIAILSQIGLLLFMFVVGMEVELADILKQRAAIVLVSCSGSQDYRHELEEFTRARRAYEYPRPG
jgi:Kef-type K+ transport system membrane component KefB